MLFICGHNRLRSPTAEQIFATWPGVETASAGLKNDADVRVDPELIAWADIIFVMERTHRQKLAQSFRTYLQGKRIICLDIRDEYEFMQPELVKLLQSRVSPHLVAT